MNKITFSESRTRDVVGQQLFSMFISWAKRTQKQGSIIGMYINARQFWLAFLLLAKQKQTNY
jgi:hypothetical protein